MERAVRKLAPIPSAPSNAFPVFFLSGDQFWYQTIFCAYSLRVHAGCAIKVIIIDDGTLTGDQATELARIIPGTQVRWLAETTRKLDELLPCDRFPTLRRRRLVYPHLRKLTDVHVGNNGWNVVLDSDMLFYHRPNFFLDWLSGADRPFHLVDVEDAYGYSNALMTELAGATIPSRLNVGMCGLHSNSIDWDLLEAWCDNLLKREGGHYLQEQALTAMLLAGRPCAVAPQEEYIVKPDRAESENARGVVHHYVGASKLWYFRFGWKHISTMK
jgi:hypothetical protein